MFLGGGSSKTEVQHLKHFIGQVKDASSLENERAVISIELTTIRRAFLDATELTLNHKCRLLLELLFIFTAGHDIGVTGSFESLNLLVSNNTFDRCLAYHILATLYPDHSDVTTCLAARIMCSLQSQSTFEISAALSAAANMIDKDTGEVLVPHIQRIANPANSATPEIRRKAYIALLRCMTTNSSLLPTDMWAPRLAQALLTEHHQGCLISLSSLILECLNNATVVKGWEIIFAYALRKLNEIRTKNFLPATGYYHNLPSPWLQVLLLRILQKFPCPKSTSLTEILEELLTQHFDTFRELVNMPLDEATKCERRDSGNEISLSRTHAEWAVLSEAVCVVAHFHECLSRKLKASNLTILTGFIMQKQAHLRYIGLQAMCRIAHHGIQNCDMEGRLANILSHLHDNDITLRGISADLAYLMATSENWQTVKEAFTSALLYKSDERLLEDLPLKTAALIEKFAPTLETYVEATVDLLSVAPDFTVWYRVAQMVAGFACDGERKRSEENSMEDLQFFAAKVLLNKFRVNWPVNDCLLQLGAYVLGEYGHLLVTESPPICSWRTLISVLYTVYKTSKMTTTKTIVLIALMKLTNGAQETHPTLVKKTASFFKSLLNHPDMELQQRAAEMYILCHQSPSLIEAVLAMMPPYATAIKWSATLSRRLHKFMMRDENKTLKVTESVSHRIQEKAKTSQSGSNSSHPDVALTQFQSPLEDEKSENTSFTSNSSITDTEQESSKTSCSLDVEISDPTILWMRACVDSKISVLIRGPVVHIASCVIRQIMTTRVSLIFKNVSPKSVFVVVKPTVDNLCYRIIEPHSGTQQLLSSGQTHTVIMDLQLDRIHSNPIKKTIIVSNETQVLSKSIDIVLPVTPLSFCEELKLSKEAYRAKMMGLASSTPTHGNLRRNLTSVQQLESFLTRSLKMHIFRIGMVIYGSFQCSTLRGVVPVIIRLETGTGEACLSVKCISSELALQFSCILRTFLFAKLAL